MSTVEVANDVISTISTPADRQKLVGMIKEFSDSCTRQEGEAELRKNIAQRAREEFGIRTADFNAMGAEYHAESKSKQVEKLELVVDQVETIRTWEKNLNASVVSTPVTTTESE